MPKLMSDATVVEKDMPHVFVPTLPETAESQAAIAKVRNWVSKYVLE